MEVVDTLASLWRRRWLVLLAAVIAALAAVLIVYRVSLSPLGLESRGVTYAVGTGSVLVDAQRSPLVDADAEVSSLNQRAPIIASALGSADLRARLARAVGARPEDVGLGSRGAEPVNQPEADERAIDIVQRAQTYQVLFRTITGSPAIQIETQAPTEREARILVAVAAAGARRYVSATFGDRGGSAATRLVIRRLQTPTAATINPSGDAQALAAAGLGIFGVLLFLVLLLGRVADTRRAHRERSGASPDAVQSA